MRCGTYSARVAQAGVRLPPTLEADKPALNMIVVAREKIMLAEIHAMQVLQSSPAYNVIFKAKICINCFSY